jgi:hypothetical protein
MQFWKNFEKKKQMIPPEIYTQMLNDKDELDRYYGGIF